MNTLWFGNRESQIIGQRFTNTQGGRLECRVRSIIECFEEPIATKKKKNVVILGVHDRCAAEVVPPLTDILKCLGPPNP
jgi:hypothetical protein